MRVNEVLNEAGWLGAVADAMKSNTATAKAGDAALGRFFNKAKNAAAMAMDRATGSTKDQARANLAQKKQQQRDDLRENTLQVLSKKFYKQWLTYYNKNGPYADTDALKDTLLEWTYSLLRMTYRGANRGRDAEAAFREVIDDNISQGDNYDTAESKVAATITEILRMIADRRRQSRAPSGGDPNEVNGTIEPNEPLPGGDANGTDVATRQGAQQGELLDPNEAIQSITYDDVLDRWVDGNDEPIQDPVVLQALERFKRQALGVNAPRYDQPKINQNRNDTPRLGNS